MLIEGFVPLRRSRADFNLPPGSVALGYARRQVDLGPLSNCKILGCVGKDMAGAEAGGFLLTRQKIMTKIDEEERRGC